MGMYFELILFIATVASGVIALVDIIFFAKKRVKGTSAPLLADYARSLFPVFFVVLLLRSFVVEPYRIPSGSMLPDLKINDFILVNKFAYGVKMPVWDNVLLKVGKPARGDVIVFRFPVYPKIDFIKRVIGVPGDHVSYKNKHLYINGKLVPQKFVNNEIEPADSTRLAVNVMHENLFGVKHNVIVEPFRKVQGFSNVIVPKDEYFVMGDNRDDSEDSRYWGFVPSANLVGKAFRVWFSWNSDRFLPRWSRIGKKII